MLRSDPDPINEVQTLLQQKTKKASMTLSEMQMHLNSLKLAREKDIRENTEEQQWYYPVSGWQTSAQEVQKQLINYNILNQCYWTPSRMARLEEIMIYVTKRLERCDMIADIFLSKLFDASPPKNSALCMLVILPKICLQ